MKPQPASFNQRLLAQSVDLTLMFPAGVVLDRYLQPEPLTFWLLCLLGYQLYSLAFENSDWKGTPGKKILQLEIRSDSGGNVTFSTILARSLLKWLSFMLLLGGFFMIYFHPKGKSLHDQLTGTGVISKITSRGNW